MYRIALLTGGYPPIASGDSVNVSTIAAELIRQGHKVRVFSADGPCCENDAENGIYRQQYGFFTGKLRRVIYEIKTHTDLSRLLYFCEFFDTLLTGPMKNRIMAFRPDIMITVCSPFRNMIIGSQLRKKLSDVRWYPYYLDSFFSSPHFSVTSAAYLIKKERNVLKRADRVIMLRWMAKDYIVNKVADAKKIRKVNLPLIPYECKKAAHDTDRLALVYTGQLYKDVREPSAALEVLARLSGEYLPDLSLIIVGHIHGFSDEEKKQWKTTLSGRLTLMDAVSPEAVRQYFDWANIFISIGNNNSQQMPSKIFQYIGTGKPIIHFYKIEDCPVRKLLSRYSNALCVPEKGCNVAAVYRFIKEKGSAAPLSAERILRDFKEYDLKSVVKAFLE